MPKFHLDPVLLWEVGRRTDGSNVHKVNNLLAVYHGKVDLLNQALEENAPEKIKRLTEEVLQATRRLQIFVNTGIAHI